MASGWKISSCVVTMKHSWMAWAPNAFLIRQPAEISHAALTRGAIVDLMEAINSTRQRVLKEQPRGFLSHAFIDTDGTIAATFGECKGGIGLSYKGIWG